MTAGILDDVAGYYSAKLAEHGQTPRGVDWNSEDSQRLRFEQLSRVIDRTGGFSLNDLGCGYGAMLEFLRPRYPGFSYTGIDVSADMVAAAGARHTTDANARFVVAGTPPGTADFGIASGIFNVKLGWDEASWRGYVETTLDALAATSTRGFAFNCLTSYSDADRMRPDLHYADPLALFDLCKRRYSRNVALLHDYGLYEFTLIVRKAL